MIIIGVILALIIATIIFGAMIKDFWDRQQAGEIVIYRNIYDMILNAVVYILPAAVFFVENPNFNNTLCYILLCVGFTVFMCLSACDSNYSTGTKVAASIIKIITGVETILVIIVVLLVLFLILGARGTERKEEYD